jgi:predicted Zn-dependent protease
MLKRIQTILDGTSLDGWHIHSSELSSQELFFVQDAIDMTRSKNVHKVNVTVYKNFDTFKGSSTIKLEPTMTDKEIKSAVDEAAYAATFVKNDYYTLPKPSDETIKTTNSDTTKWAPDFTGVIQKHDLNSSELFINNANVHILNSEGIDVTYHKDDVYVEAISSGKGINGEVESYKEIKCASFDHDSFDHTLTHVIQSSIDKADAGKTPSLDNINVILSGVAVERFFNYYISRTSVKAIYQNISTYKIGDKINDTKGDPLTITLHPTMEGSTESVPYDEDGVLLKTTKVIEEGVVKSFWGPSRFSYYLNESPVGIMRNIAVDAGKSSIEEMKKEPYIELVEFSDFAMDALTGHFGGEVRLGYYYDGQTTTPITTGAFTSQLSAVENDLLLSKEITQQNCFVGPTSLLLKNQKISGE